MNDVAREAGVSLKTVSRVANAEAGVHAETRARVRAAMSALRFRPNHLAASLRRGAATDTVGLVIEDVTNPFYSAIASGVEAAAREQGRLTMVASCGEDAAREAELVVSLLRRRVDCLLIVPAGRDHAYLEPERDEGTPLVFLDRPPVGLAADTVLLDDRRGAREAVEHLVGHGHERIGVVAADPGLHTFGERLAGYRDGLAAHGIAEDPDLVVLGHHDVESGRRGVRRLLALPPGRRPTAIFALNTRKTLGALQAVRETASPVALVGFDDFELADMLAVPLTVVSYDPVALGRTAAALAFARLAGDASPPRRITIPTHLVARGSGERPPEERNDR